jgi:protocatechuate 3,4-dioxygenase beta subunit
VISGVVRDFEGQPAANASVNLWYYQWVSGTRTLLSSGGFTQSDDRGVYRIYGLAPG